MRWISIIVSIVFAGIPLMRLSAFAQAGDEPNGTVKLSGYVKLLNGIQFRTSLDSAISSSLLHNRFNLSFAMDKRFAAYLGIRTRIFYGEDIKISPGFGKMIAADPGFLNLSALWLDTRSVVIHSIADRAYVKYADDSWDIRLGRQRINWGISSIWNPNDLFNAYNFLDFDYEERPGSDALRLQYSTSSSASIETALNPGRTWNDAIGAGLLRWNAWGYDFQALAGIFRTDLVVGGGFAGSLGEVGLKGEISYFHPRSKQLDTIDAFEVSATIDHMIGEYYISLSGLFNSTASDEVQDQNILLGRTLSPKNLMPFRYTTYASISHSFSPLFSASIATIYSPKFKSFIFFPVFTYSLAEEIDADLVAQSYFNDVTGSYQSRANAFYLRIRVSF
ncbi:MAG: hypothetical protein Q8916_04595 [Bacteroidota bacterium]|nr:hypothetical protein [Bacteroidota bacterium]